MLLIDHSEPSEIIKLLEQSVKVSIENLNQHNLSDYFFTNAGGKRLQFSRKQSGELLGNIDNAERQLRDYYNNADENYQIIEGLITSSSITSQPHKVQAVSVRNLSKSASQLCSYKVSDTGWLHEPHTWNINSSMLFSWLHRLSKLGIITYWTTTKLDTARLLVAIYKNEQKPEANHTTLSRYIRPRLYIEDQNPFVKALMFLSSAYKLNIGEDKARKIAARYSNVAELLMAAPLELTACEGIGIKMAKKLLNALGMEY